MKRRPAAEASPPAAAPAAPALPVRLTRLLAGADVALPAGKITVQALDKLLVGKGLSPAQRIDLKSALARAGTLID